MLSSRLAQVEKRVLMCSPGGGAPGVLVVIAGPLKARLSSTWFQEPWIARSAVVGPVFNDRDTWAQPMFP